MGDTKTVSSSSSVGVGFFSLLTLIFVVMKCMGWGIVAGWSWWLVFLPSIIGFGVVILTLVLALIIAALVAFKS